MKTKIILLIIAGLAIISSANAQFDKPIITLGIGLNEPQADMRGEAFTDKFYKNAIATFVSEDYITNNYGAKTGINFFGSGKINFDKFNILRGAVTLTYNNFNTFKADKNVNTLGLVGNFGGGVDTVLVPVTYSNNFNNFGIGFGLEVAPTAFTNIISPFFNANLNLNFLSASMVRTLSAYDSLKANFTSFRIGANLNAGLEFKVNNNFGILVGAKYDWANLLLKVTDNSYASAVQFGRDNLELNDEGGVYYSSLTQPVYSTIPFPKTAKQKSMEWWTLYAGVNIYLSTAPVKKK